MIVVTRRRWKKETLEGKFEYGNVVSWELGHMTECNAPHEEENRGGTHYVLVL